MGSKYVEATLNGSGALAAQTLLMPTQGLLKSFRFSKNGQSANPSVTIEKYPTGEDVVTALSITGDMSIYPTILKESPDGTDSAERTPFALGGLMLLWQVTGGDAAGLMSVWMEWE